MIPEMTRPVRPAGVSATAIYGELAQTSAWEPGTSSLLIAIKGTVPCDGIWCATLTVRDLGSNDRGCGNSSSGNECTVYLSEDEFTHAMTDYSVDKLRVQSDGQLQLYLNRNITTDSQSLVLHVGSDTFAFEDANVKGVGPAGSWNEFRSQLDHRRRDWTEADRRRQRHGPTRRFPVCRRWAWN